MHVGPGGVEGEAEYMLYFYDLAEPENILDSVRVLFETTTTAIHDLTSASLRIYPNPTTSYFQISDPAGVAKVIVYNIVGNRLREFDARNISRFDVSDLPEGIFLVRLFDADQRVLKTVRLSKR
jgi:hypothetical protein